MITFAQAGDFNGLAVAIFGVVLAITLLITAKLIDWRNRWSPA